MHNFLLSSSHFSFNLSVCQWLNVKVFVKNRNWCAHWTPFQWQKQSSVSKGVKRVELWSKYITKRITEQKKLLGCGENWAKNGDDIIWGSRILSLGLDVLMFGFSSVFLFKDFFLFQRLWNFFSIFFLCYFVCKENIKHRHSCVNINWYTFFSLREFYVHSDIDIWIYFTSSGLLSQLAMHGNLSRWSA